MDNRENQIKETENEYWQDFDNKSLEGMNLKEEFNIGMAQHSRRDFLKRMGFSVAVTSVVACTKIPPQKVIPFLKKNEQIIPGVADWYATTCRGCFAHCSLLVKCREGRPIKIEGNEMSPQSRGGVCPYAQGSLLSLYDSYRIEAPAIKGQSLSWDAFDLEMIKKLREVESQNKKIVLITNTLRSPSTLYLIEDFKKSYKHVSHIAFAPHDINSVLEAQEINWGERGFPVLDIKKANLIVSFSADFLGTWGDCVAQTKDYSERRNLFKTRETIRHIQLEKMMSLTGASADTRLILSPYEEDAFVQNILIELQKSSNKTLIPNIFKLPLKDNAAFDKVLNELKSNRGTSIVISGSRDTNIQVFVNAINELLGNWGETIHRPYYSHSYWASDSQMENFVQWALRGEVGAAIFWDVNPVYDYYDSKKLHEALQKIPVSLAMSQAPNETSMLCHYVMPSLNQYESWGDFEVQRGLYSFSQPLIRTLFYARQEQDAILKWIGRNETYYDYLKDFWKTIMFAQVDSMNFSFLIFWDRAIHDGIVKTKDFGQTKLKKIGLSGFSSANKINDSSKIQLFLYQKVAIRSGKSTNNPWLLELPDPITKATWDNYLQISPRLAKEKALKNGDVVALSTEKEEIKIPVLVQPGLNDLSVAIALGYGRKVCGKAGKDVGINAYPFMKYENGTYCDGAYVLKIEKTSKHYELALTQTHHALEGRDLIKEATLAQYIRNPHAGNEKNIKLLSLSPEHKKEGHQWAMTIDLNKCTGCSGCVISCSAENNVPVVGKTEVKKRREMHWIRLDRYYKGDENNPEVVHQPVTCMHCENAPCESVCPVIASVHSSDGLNQQVYNRCVGTRYCENNCPYKVRRFNWFDYAHDDQYAKLVLNPDVAVRSGGVMEKCTMCIQRIQAAELHASKEGRPLKDGEIKLACQQSCPANAITFGDLNDKDSEISKKMEDPRFYRLLEDLNVKPRVGYLTKIRNKD